MIVGLERVVRCDGMNPGDVVAGRFEIERLAGQGGMGAVYQARDRHSGARVALKLLRDARRSSEDEQRFVREARVLAELSHPNIVRYVSHGLTSSGAHYLAMEWLEGEDLGQQIARSGPLTVGETVTLAGRVAQALSAAHARGILPIGQPGADRISLGQPDGQARGVGLLEAAHQLVAQARLPDAGLGDHDRHPRPRLLHALGPQVAQHRQLALPPGRGRIAGGYQIQRLAAQLGSVAPSGLSVLLFGESGTGKEVFAQELHERSGRGGPFLAVNCAALPATLIEAELFGHRRGAFSGADRDRPGLIRAADGGTLFLDEIGDMPLDAQVKLLRVLQSREVLPVGAATPERVDVRFVCATHRDLRKLQQGERFRGDLFARLNEYSVTLPPLRERKEDLFALCRTLAARHGRPEVRETFLFMVGLLHHDFPFNVRELEALIKRWIATSSGSELDVQHLTDEIKEQMKTYGRSPAAPAPELPARPPVDPPLEPRLRARPIDPEQRARIEEALRQHGGNVAAAARALGMHRTQLRRLLERFEPGTPEDPSAGD